MKIRRIFAVLAAAVISSSLCISGCTPSSDSEQSTKQSVTESSVNSNDPKQESSSDEAVSNSQPDNEKSDISNLTSKQDSKSEENKITPAVWEAKDSKGNVLYMMGTIHVADEDVSVLPDYFEAAYAKCDALAVECDTTSASFDISVYSKLMYTDGTTIKDHVPEEQYNTAVKVLTDAGQYMPTLDYMKPVIWSSYVELAAASNAGLSANYGIDYTMLDRAKEEGKEILELESVDFQINMMADLSDDIQSVLFEEIAQENIIDKYKKQLSDLYEEWKKGNNPEDSENTDESSVDEETLKLAEEYNKILTDDRNIGMAEKIESYMKDGKKVMVLAGAAHFYGEKGILKLLENDGCTVRKLSSEDAKDFSASAQTSEIEESSKEHSAAVETDPGVPRAA